MSRYCNRCNHEMELTDSWLCGKCENPNALRRLEVICQGEPAPKGSMRSFVRGGRAIVTHDNRKTKPWQDLLEKAIKVAMKDAGCTELLDEPVSVECFFFLQRPASASKRKYPHCKPDLDKLQRVVGDALEGTAVTNDSRIVEWKVYKRYSETPGAQIVVTPLGAR